MQVTLSKGPNFKALHFPLIAPKNADGIRYNTNNIDLE